MNHAYGVKHYLLKEEAVIPSYGYGDALVHVKNFSIREEMLYSLCVVAY